MKMENIRIGVLILQPKTLVYSSSRIAQEPFNSLKCLGITSHKILLSSQIDRELQPYANDFSFKIRLYLWAK